jgi:hypothetical protein
MTRLVCAALFFLLLAGVTTQAAESLLKLEAQLVVGSNDPHSTNGVPVSVQVAKKLARLPLKWSYYYVISSQQFSVAKDESKKVSLSSECQISVKNLGGENVQLTLMGNISGKIKQTLPKGHTIVAGGNAGNNIVVLRQAD